MTVPLIVISKLSTLLGDSELFTVTDVFLMGCWLWTWSLYVLGGHVNSCFVSEQELVVSVKGFVVIVLLLLCSSVFSKLGQWVCLSLHKYLQRVECYLWSHLNVLWIVNHFVLVGWLFGIHCWYQKYYVPV